MAPPPGAVGCYGNHTWVMRHVRWLKSTKPGQGGARAKGEKSKMIGKQSRSGRSPGSGAVQAPPESRQCGSRAGLPEVSSGHRGVLTSLGPRDQSGQGSRTGLWHAACCGQAMSSACTELSGACGQHSLPRGSDRPAQQATLPGTDG
jgi:hypothetical protein